MINLFRILLINVSVAAILAGVSLQFVREGPMREVIRLAAGLMMTLALLVPLTKLPAARMVFSDALRETETAAALAAEENQRIAASSVGSAIAVYIQSRAGEMGIDCTASVHMSSDENGWLVTEGVTLYLESASEEEIGAVCQMVAQECGIPIYQQEVKEK